MKTIKKAFLLWGAVAITFGCSKQGPIQSQASLRAMSQSMFETGAAVPEPLIDLGAPELSTASNSFGTDNGFIAGPGGSNPSGGGATDGGSIGNTQPLPPNPVTGDSGNSGTSSGSSSSSTVPGTGSTIDDMSPGAVVVNPSPETGDGGSVVINNPVTPNPEGGDGGSVVINNPVTPNPEGGDGGSVVINNPVTPNPEGGDGGSVVINNPVTPNPEGGDGGSVVINNPVTPNPEGGDGGSVVINNPVTPNPEGGDGGSVVINNPVTPNPEGGDGGSVVINNPVTPNPEGGDGGSVVINNPVTPNPEGGDGGSVVINNPVTPNPVTGDTGSTTPTSPCNVTCGCGCQKPFKFQLRRVCSINRSKGKGLFFEEAKNPIFTIEAVNKSSGGMTTWLASMGFSRLPSGPTVARVNGVTAISVASQKLTQVDLMSGKYTSQFALKMSDFKKKMGGSWSFAYLNVRVCEDSNNNGFCFDEPSVNQLAFEYPSFKAGSFPRSVQLDIWSGRYKTVANNPEVCETQYSPLVLDLRGNGLALMGPEQGVFFDLNDTGSKIPTGWIGSSDDALLVRDLDDSGRIETGAELFGSATRVANGARAINGFEALRPLDSDGDGIISRNDSLWSELKLWIDRNKDGVSQRFELMSLRQAGIESINLGYTEVLEVDPHGNQTRQRSTFVRQVGFKKYVLVVSDVWFNTIATE